MRDLNSKNKTFINGQAIPAQYECEIFDGNRLTLGNEEFIFNKKAMHSNAKYLIEQVKSRQEKDNISVVLIRAE